MAAGLAAGLAATDSIESTGHPANRQAGVKQKREV